MHLSALRLRGFKSFPEQVELRFFPGVAVIVGPNGSGKSNISDSLQWAMAASAPSAIRAQAGTDVLFAGTDGRPAAGVCEVELVLDNSDGRIDLPQAEVSVMRRLHRDGTSEYLLGRRAVRRLEVQEALADAGIGRDLHCVISQGSVDEVLLARPEERRALIEEAAGLGKYQRRRRRARARLGRVRVDLERASDIEREIQRRLRPLALQATAAERAEVLGREAAALRLRLLASESATRAPSPRHARRRARAGDEARASRSPRRPPRHGPAARRPRASSPGLAAEQERASARAWGLASSLERLSDRRSALAERLSEAGREAEREARAAFALEQESGAARAESEHAAGEAARLVAEAEHVDPRDDDALAAATKRAEDALETALAARRDRRRCRGRGAARAQRGRPHAGPGRDADRRARRADDEGCRRAGRARAARGCRRRGRTACRRGARGARASRAQPQRDRRGARPRAHARGRAPGRGRRSGRTARRRRGPRSHARGCGRPR